MKLKTLLFTICIALVFNTFSQKKSKTDVSFDLAIQKYHTAIAYLDYNTAINALHEVLVLKPKQTNYKDSLLALYFNNGMATSTVLLAKEMEKEGNSNPSTYEALAITYQNAGMLKEALSYYEKLNATNDNLFYLYQISTIQYNLTRLKECTQTLSTIINHKESLKSSVKIDYDKQASQKVPYAAAAYNILGVLALQLKQNDQAIQNFNEALKIYPDFILAKNNVELLKK